MNTGSSHDDGPNIFRCTRAQAIEDGVLVVLDPGGDAWLASMLSFAENLLELNRRGFRGTGPDGKVTLWHVPDGNYSLHVRCENCEDANVPATIAGSHDEPTVTLKPRTTDLD